MAAPAAPASAEQVLHAAHPLTSAGGLVIAVVTDHDEDTLRRIASLRQPGGTGLLLLVEAATFAGPAPPSSDSRAEALAGLVASAGWSTAVVRAGTDIGAVWSALTASSGVHGGSPAMRSRAADATLAALATMVAAWPLSTLLEQPTWVRSALLLVAAVALSGIGARLLGLRGWQVAAVQLAVVLLAAGGLYGRGHLWHGLPTVRHGGLPARPDRPGACTPSRATRRRRRPPAASRAGRRLAGAGGAAGGLPRGDPPLPLPGRPAADGYVPRRRRQQRRLPQPRCSSSRSQPSGS